MRSLAAVSLLLLAVGPAVSFVPGSQVLLCGTGLVGSGGAGTAGAKSWNSERLRKCSGLSVSRRGDASTALAMAQSDRSESTEIKSKPSSRFGGINLASILAAAVVGCSSPQAPGKQQGDAGLAGPRSVETMAMVANTDERALKTATEPNTAKGGQSGPEQKSIYDLKVIDLMEGAKDLKTKVGNLDSKTTILGAAGALAFGSGALVMVYRKIGDEAVKAKQAGEVLMEETDTLSLVGDLSERARLVVEATQIIEVAEACRDRASALLVLEDGQPTFEALRLVADPKMSCLSLPGRLHAVQTVGEGKLPPKIKLKDSKREPKKAVAMQQPEAATSKPSGLTEAQGMAIKSRVQNEIASTVVLLNVATKVIEEAERCGDKAAAKKVLENGQATFDALGLEADAKMGSSSLPGRLFDIQGFAKLQSSVQAASEATTPFSANLEAPSETAVSFQETPRSLSITTKLDQLLAERKRNASASQAQQAGQTGSTAKPAARSTAPKGGAAASGTIKDDQKEVDRTKEFLKIESQTKTLRRPWE